MFVLNLIRSLVFSSIPGSPGYWGEPLSLMRAGWCGIPRAGPGWRGGGSTAGALACSGTRGAGRGDCTPMGVRVSVLLAQQIIAGKLNGMGFKLVAQDPGCQETPVLKPVQTCFPRHSYPALKL